MPRPSPAHRPEPRITLSEEGGVRYLHFGSEWVQGAMRIGRPWRLEIDYIERMMAWLLLLDPPTRILQLGLGAGALTRWCWRHLPESGIDVVESAGNVIRVARSHFSVPPDDARLTVHHADAARFVADAVGNTSVTGAAGAAGVAEVTRSQTWRVIQADLYDSEARGPVCDSLAFYRACRAALDPAAGILVVNLFGETASYSRNLSRIARAFDARVLVLPAVPAENVVVLAFSGPPIEVSAQRLLARAAAVERRWRLPAGSWARTLLDDPTHRLSDRGATRNGSLVV